jgi:hypothetical protein
MSSRLVKVKNLMSDDLTITLTDGTDISMEPFQKGKQGHISKAISYDALPQSVVKKGGMLARNLVKLIEVGGN